MAPPPVAVAGADGALRPRLLSATVLRPVDECGQLLVDAGFSATLVVDRRADVLCAGDDQSSTSSSPPGRFAAADLLLCIIETAQPIVKTVLRLCKRADLVFGLGSVSKVGADHCTLVPDGRTADGRLVRLDRLALRANDVDMEQLTPGTVLEYSAYIDASSGELCAMRVRDARLADACVAHLASQRQVVTGRVCATAPGFVSLLTADGVSITAECAVGMAAIGDLFVCVLRADRLPRAYPISQLGAGLVVYAGRHEARVLDAGDASALTAKRIVLAKCDLRHLLADLTKVLAHGDPVQYVRESGSDCVSELMLLPLGADVTAAASAALMLGPPVVYTRAPTRLAAASTCSSYCPPPPPLAYQGGPLYLQPAPPPLQWVNAGSDPSLARFPPWSGANSSLDVAVFDSSNGGGGEQAAENKDTEGEEERAANGPHDGGEPAGSQWAKWSAPSPAGVEAPMCVPHNYAAVGRPPPSPTVQVTATATTDVHCIRGEHSAGAFALCDDGQSHSHSVTVTVKQADDAAEGLGSYFVRTWLTPRAKTDYLSVSSATAESKEGGGGCATACDKTADAAPHSHDEREPGRPVGFGFGFAPEPCLAPTVTVAAARSPPAPQQRKQQQHDEQLGRRHSPPAQRRQQRQHELLWRRRSHSPTADSDGGGRARRTMDRREFLRLRPAASLDALVFKSDECKRGEPEPHAVAVRSVFPPAAPPSRRSPLCLAVVPPQRRQAQAATANCRANIAAAPPLARTPAPVPSAVRPQPPHSSTARAAPSPMAAVLCDIGKLANGRRFNEPFAVATVRLAAAAAEHAQCRCYAHP